MNYLNHSKLYETLFNFSPGTHAICLLKSLAPQFYCFFLALRFLTIELLSFVSALATISHIPPVFVCNLIPHP